MQPQWAIKMQNEEPCYYINSIVTHCEVLSVVFPVNNDGMDTIISKQTG